MTCFLLYVGLLDAYERLVQERAKDCDMFGDDEEDTAVAVQQGVTNDGSDYVYDETSGYGFKLLFLFSISPLISQVLG